MAADRPEHALALETIAPDFALTATDA